MFEFFQRHRKIGQWALVLLIVPAFILIGVEGYNSSQDAGPKVAEFKGGVVTEVQFKAALDQEISRIKSSNPNVDVKLIDTPKFRESLLERMVLEKIQASAAIDKHFVVTDGALAKALMTQPEIAGLIGPDGKLDAAKYKELLASAQMTPEMYEARVRASLASNQVIAPLQSSSFKSTTLSDLSVQAFLQQREVQTALINPADFVAQVKLTDADLEAYYKANLLKFQSPEQADVEFVVLDQAAVSNAIVLDNAALKEHFEKNKSQYMGNEERRASHILISAEKSASKSVKDAAKAKATALREQVLKDPASFAKVAKANSQDPGSAANGGDLDFFGKGAMTPPFEQATFALKKGEISAVIETDFGYHIIQLTDVKPGKERTFEEVLPELQAEFRRQKATTAYAEQAEKFSTMVYEQGDSLKVVADSLKLKLETISGLAKNAPQAAPGTEAIVNNPKFIEAVFSAESTSKKKASEAIDLGANKLVSVRVIKYQAAAAIPFAQVKDKVSQTLTQIRAVELAKKDGVAKLAQAKAKPESVAFGAAVLTSRSQAQAQNQNPKVIEAALTLDAKKLPAITGVDLGDQGYMLVKANKVVVDAAANAQVTAQLSQQLAQAWGEVESQAYIDSLKKDYKVRLIKTASKPEKEEKAQ